MGSTPILSIYMQNTPVTLVIPCYNSSETIERVIEAAMGENFHETICINNNSDDDTLEKLEKLPVLIVEEKKQGTVWARRAGAACAETEWLAMIDDDVILQPGWKQSMLDFLEEIPSADAITGNVSISLPPQFYWAKDMLSNWRATTYEYLQSDQVFGAATFIRKKTFLESTRNPERPGRNDRDGTFDGCGEDIEMARKIMRAGGRIFHNPNSSAIHNIERWRRSYSYLKKLHQAYIDSPYIKEHWS